MTLVVVAMAERTSRFYIKAIAERITTSVKRRSWYMAERSTVSVKRRMVSIGDGRTQY